ncbi:hypothetical protein MLD38_022784 [Melastoma candidum]|uniref:Uncharacterized protein n=1 Tax=Melastoma candidum TaxID=119954 RepID=A0ACB9QL08_9MYRT|nr:hypothetical protein MLD38_022784 [Melastoma candidum]
MPPFCIYFLSSFIAAAASFFPVHSISDDGAALLDFKQSISLDPLSVLSSWDSSHDTPCSWSGVACSGQGRVISLILPNKGLSGTLPASLGKLAALRHVNFRNNSLHGSLPPELFGAVGIQSLVVSQNYLSGPVPDEIGKLSSLHTLVLFNNSFGGRVPLSLIQCRTLKMLDLSRNNFSGYLRDDFGSSLQSLEVLDLSHNELNGSIPSGLGCLSKLQGTLDMSYNHFAGPIPETLGKLPQNVYLDLSYNNLSGPIPQTDTTLNSGPTAFTGNQYLCGPPLEIPCPSSYPASNPQQPTVVPSNVARRPSSDEEQRHGGFGRGVLAAVIASAALGSCFIGFSLSYVFKTTDSCKDCKSVGVYLMKDPHCGGVIVENLEEQHFVPLDARVDFDMEKLLVASAFLLRKSRTGIVYKVVLENGQQLAVRRLNGESQRLKDFQAEIEAVVKVRHPNIIPLRAYCWSVYEKLLIYDYMPNSDLATTIHGKGGMATLTPLSWAARLRIMKEVALALAYIHELSPKKYVHGNLKPSNILLGSRMEAYISDFGLGRLARAASSGCEESMSSTPLELVLSSTPEQIPSSYSSPYDPSTPIARSSSAENSMRLYYRTPEASMPSQKWDVYSFGAVIIEMVTARVAEPDLVRWVQTSVDKRGPVSEIVDPLLLVHDLDKEEEIVAVVELGLSCMDKTPERRPSMRQASNRLDKIAEEDVESLYLAWLRSRFHEFVTALVVIAVASDAEGTVRDVLDTMMEFVEIGK